VLEGARKVLGNGLPLALCACSWGNRCGPDGHDLRRDVEVFLEPISPGSLNHLNLFRKVEEIQRRGGSALLVTLLEEARWKEGEVPKMLLQKAGTHWDPSWEERMDAVLRREMEGLLKRQEPAFITYRRMRGRSARTFCRARNGRRSSTCSAAACLQQISPLARRVGFKVVVIDDRAEFCRPCAMAPQAEEAASNALCGGHRGKLPVDELSYLVIVTRRARPRTDRAGTMPFEAGLGTWA